MRNDRIGRLQFMGLINGIDTQEYVSFTTTRALGGLPKRVFDFVFALFFIFLFSSIFIFTAIVTRLTSGPVIYKHNRVGFGGRTFRCFKFRTMVVDADKALNALLRFDLAARAEWERSQKIVDDPRITHVGRFLRRSSLDELPQLFNVIRGEMSLVGPRPIAPSEMPRYGNRLDMYLSARPGLTGAWQVSGRSDCDYDQRVELDANYVSNWRFSTDIFILLRTVGAVFAEKGSY
ncbi:MAG: exopolysaccharide biosynthesis protein [Hyphomicrobiales bacterium]|nr:MAG: exopolysaccharide biosynthesis protein [Hyphomicrobiales bacterium]